MSSKARQKRSSPRSSGLRLKAAADKAKREEEEQDEGHDDDSGVHTLSLADEESVTPQGNASRLHPPPPPECDDSTPKRPEDPSFAREDSLLRRSSRLWGTPGEDHPDLVVRRHRSSRSVVCRRRRPRSPPPFTTSTPALPSTESGRINWFYCTVYRVMAVRI